MASQVAPAKSVQQAAQGGVLFKLVMFTVSLAVVPISSFFLTQKYIWDGNSTYAALSAVFAANFVMVAYIVVSVWEDTTSTTVSPEKKESTAAGKPIITENKKDR